MNNHNSTRSIDQSVVDALLEASKEQDKFQQGHTNSIDQSVLDSLLKQQSNAAAQPNAQIIKKAPRAQKLQSPTMAEDSEFELEEISFASTSHQMASSHESAKSLLNQHSHEDQESLDASTVPGMQVDAAMDEMSDAQYLEERSEDIQQESLPQDRAPASSQREDSQPPAALADLSPTLTPSLEQSDDELEIKGPSHTRKLIVLLMVMLIAIAVIITTQQLIS